MTPFIGQICMFGFGWAPRSWATCDGQVVAISSNEALFSLLGTTYGGDGRTTFGLPDLRGRVPMHHGNGPGLTGRRLGVKEGQETKNLDSSEMPVHKHDLVGNIRFRLGNLAGDTAIGFNRSLAAIAGDDDGSGTTGDLIFNTTPQYNLNRTLDAGTIDHSGLAVANAGSGQGFGLMQPYSVISFAIALDGVYPSRD